jgi:uncharacterized protein YhaN
MKITGIHIDGFGLWHDRHWTELSPTLNVFYGPNEAGKTTLMSFVRSILFGFERRSHPRRYEPLKGGSYGGAVEVSHDGEAVRIERKAGRHVRGSVCLYADGDDAVSGEMNADQALEQLLGGTTRTLYHNVFAFGLEELADFRTLEDGDVASHISGAGMGVGASRWSQVWKDLEERRSKLFLPRGQSSTINRALKQLESVREELVDSEGEPEDYFLAHEQHAGLEAEIQGLETTADRLRKRLAHYVRLREAEPQGRRRSQIEAELSSIEVIDSFPEGGVERLNLLLHQRRQLEAETSRQQEDCEKIRTERCELASRYIPQELIRRTRAVESLRSLIPRRDASENVLTGAQERRGSVAAELERILGRRDAARPPSTVATFVFTAAVATGAAALFLARQNLGGSFIVAALLMMAVWYFRRMQLTRVLDREIEATKGRLQSAEEEVLRLDADHREIWKRIEGLAGRGDFSYADLGRENAKIQDLNAMADRIRSIDEALASEERHRRRILEKSAQNQKDIETLLTEGGAVSESEFFRRAEVYQTRRHLLDALARVPLLEIMPDPEVQDIRAFDFEEHRRTAARLEQIKERLRVARTEAGRLEERISALGQSEERSRVRGREQSIRARIDEASEKWAVLTLCRTLLDETRRIYETERQPEVIRHASEFLSTMSEGRWQRVIAPLDGGDLLVESETGSRVQPENLSRGTAEQLYLAMRLALVREYSQHVSPLPVIFDDIFVNFDPDRTRQSIQAVRELSSTHQILLFTCHPHLLDLTKEIVPSAKVYPLQ